MSTVRHVLAGALVGVATIVVLVALGLLLVGNPVWFRLTQERAQADAWTGWPMATVTAVTNAVFADVVIGPPDFDQVVDGAAVFTERERNHFRDVRVAVVGFAALTILALALLVLGHRLARGARWFWQGVAGGAVALAGGVMLLGFLSLAAFEQVFEVFHQLLFPEGSYNFDPTTERMVQLFPMQLWFETSIALGVVLVVLAGLTLAICAIRLDRASRGEEPRVGGVVPTIRQDVS